MHRDDQRLKRIASALLLIGAVAAFGAAGCSDIRPEPNVEEGGMLESPTHEQDALHEEEQHQEGGQR